MEFQCCSLVFNDSFGYLQHLKFHKNNSTLTVKCNSCGHNSRSWDVFRKHIKSHHSRDSVYSNFSLFDKTDEIATDFGSQEQNENLSDPLIQSILEESNRSEKITSNSLNQSF